MFNPHDYSHYEKRWLEESQRRQKHFWRWLAVACVVAVVLGGAVGAFIRL